MSAILKFGKATLLGGILFVVPVVIVMMLVREAVRMTADVLRPVSRIVPTERVAGMVVADLLAVVVILVVCFTAGLFMGTGLGRALSQRLEHLVLRRMRGFTFFKSVAYGMAGVDAKSELSVALARIEDAWVLAFVVERHSSGLSTVFIPSAPTPLAGAIYYLPDDRLKPLDVPVSTVMACIMRLGVGSNELLDKAALVPPE